MDSFWSPSSRRAWIEIVLQQQYDNIQKEVALLAEGVDRNSNEGCMVMIL